MLRTLTRNGAGALVLGALAHSARMHGLEADKAVPVTTSTPLTGLVGVPASAVHQWDANWDFRAPPNKGEDAKDAAVAPTPLAAADPLASATTVSAAGALDRSKKATATRHIVMVRHGQYQDKESDHAKRVLTDLGRRQLALTGDRLAKLFPEITAVYSSDMPRAVESAAIVCGRLTELLHKDFVAVVDPMLKEGAPVPPSPSSSLYTPDVYFRDGARIEAAFRQHFYRASPSQEKDSVDVLVCHGNVIRYFTMRALQLPTSAWLRTSLPHGSITWISIRPSGNVSLRYFGNDGFIPADQVSTS